jgi:hypothetical protein
MSVGARVLKYQHFRAYAKTGPYVVKVYSDPGSGLTTVDGWVRRTSVIGDWWPDLVSGAGVDCSTIGDLNPTIHSSVFANRWIILSRAIMTFDLVVVPPGADIQSAIFRGWIGGIADNLGLLPRLALVTSNPLSNNNLVAGDYPRVGAVPISTVLDFAFALQNSYQHLDILPAYLSLVEPGQILKLGIREQKWDASGISPAWLSYQITYFGFVSVDTAIAEHKPYLEITYYL